MTLHDSYNICVVDIGSPRLGNIGWCLLDTDSGLMKSGTDLDKLVPLIAETIRRRALILGLEAPLFVPIRKDLLLATKGRKGEGRRPWSAGAGAQVLAMNLPIMTYLFTQLVTAVPDDTAIYLNEQSGFTAHPKQIMLFEALVSGVDKGDTHEQDAQIMAEYCHPFSKDKILPPCILEPEDDIKYLNLAASALMHCKWIDDSDALYARTPIYRPSTRAFD